MNRTAWSQKIFPTKVLDADSLRQVAEAGCTRFDFDPAVAAAFCERGKSRHRNASLSHFKRRFGGNVVPLPPNLVRFPNPAVRLATATPSSRSCDEKSANLMRLRASLPAPEAGTRPSAALHR